MTMLIPEFAFEIKLYALIKMGNWLLSSNNFFYQIMRIQQYLWEENAYIYFF